MTGRVQVGEVFVDAGIVMIGDPCYTLPDSGSHRTEAAKDWSKFCDATLGGDQENNTPFGKGIAIVVESGYGDGSYPVFVTYNDEGRVASVTVEFIEDET